MSKHWRYHAKYASAAGLLLSSAGSALALAAGAAGALSAANARLAVIVGVLVFAGALAGHLLLRGK